MMRRPSRLSVPHDIAELIRNMHPHLKKKIKASLKTILVNPDSGKALKKELIGLRSFRISQFRIICRPASDNTIDIIAIGPRARIYEETFRIISRTGNVDT